MLEELTLEEHGFNPAAKYRLNHIKPAAPRLSRDIAGYQ
jgi:hypothetical protein